MLFPQGMALFQLPLNPAVIKPFFIWFKLYDKVSEAGNSSAVRRSKKVAKLVV